jgi:hypothetical protein
MGWIYTVNQLELDQQVFLNKLDQAVIDYGRRLISLRLVNWYKQLLN